MRTDVTAPVAATTCRRARRRALPVIAPWVLAICLACSAEEPMGVDAPVIDSPYTVGVYYYPWYGGNDFHGGRYLREHLVPPQPPVLGEYDDRDPQVIAQHLRWSAQANISLWVASWWGPGRREDNTLRQHVLPHADLGDMRIALFYETSGRVPDFTDTDNVADDIAYMAQHYFDHPNYLRVDGKPVLFVYLTRVLTRQGTLEEVVTLMRSAAAEAGTELYIVGDEVFGEPPAEAPQLGLLDAVTNYDVYGSTGAQGFAGPAAVGRYWAAQTRWRGLAHDVGVAYVPAATPGFNDKGVRQGHAAVSRKLTEEDEFGSLFRAHLQQAVAHTDSSTGGMLVITSWNEWHEDTQIEPVIEAPPTRVDDSDSGDAFTEGLEYEGYGERYLEILRQETSR
jgi:glycoprotein endo-alpha-1,2-mannosidase